MNRRSLPWLRGILVLGAALALARFLGWLKSLYYFRSFGVELSLVKPSWPGGRVGMAVGMLVVVSRAISTAKHAGSFDAAQAMRWSDAYLSRVHTARPLPEGLGPDDELYLLAATPRELILWDRAGFRFGESSHVRVVIVERSRLEWFEARREFQVQPDRRYF